MITVTREHLAGLELALSLLGLRMGYFTRCDLEQLIAQASAAPEQEAVDLPLPRTKEDIAMHGHGSWNQCLEAVQKLGPFYKRPNADVKQRAVTLPERLPLRMPHARNLPKSYAEAWNGCLDEVEKLGPLYTHPSEEIERLRAELEAESKGADRAAEAMLHWKKEADSLRHELAKAQALLYEVQPATLNDFRACWESMRDLLSAHRAQRGEQS